MSRQPIALSRRALLASAAVSVRKAKAAVQQAPPVSVGVIGSGGRGQLLTRVFQEEGSARIAAICDVYEPNLEKSLSLAGQRQSAPARAYRDYRSLLDDRSIEAVIIATPEHWHARQVLDALAAGKDVYVEKPLCRTPEEGVALVRAEEKTDRIIQVGMQRRSYDLYQEGRRLIEAGELGTVRMVRSWWLNNHLDGGGQPKLEGALDWEQWQGPMPTRVPVNPHLFRNWRHYSAYAGGIMADQGAHVFDGIHMLMKASYPAAVTAAAGRPHKALVDTPESVVVTAEYPEDFIAVFTINYAAMRYQSRNDQMNHLDGDRARMDIGRLECRVHRAGSEDDVAILKTSERGFGHATTLHVLNFLECVRTRKKPTAPMRLGFQAALVTQLANISLKEGRRVPWNASEWRVA